MSPGHLEVEACICRLVKWGRHVVMLAARVAASDNGSGRNGAPKRWGMGLAEVPTTGLGGTRKIIGQFNGEPNCLNAHNTVVVVRGRFCSVTSMMKPIPYPLTPLRWSRWFLRARHA